MVELLLKGQTYVDTRQCKNNITSLAECLQIRLENIETQSKGEGKLRLRNLSEIMKPGFGLNNNSKVTGTAEDIKDHAEEIRKQDDDGWMSKPQYKCLYCGKGFEDVVLRNSNEQLCTCYSYLNTPPPQPGTLTNSSTSVEENTMGPVSQKTCNVMMGHEDDEKYPAVGKEKEVTAAMQTLQQSDGEICPHLN